jgi:tetratricopeptide (TPR) repeat protein
MTDGVVAAAKRKGIRIFALDAGGLRIFRTFGVEAPAAFLASNPHLERILDNYARGWQLDKESSLNQLASETGGRFIHNTNDLTASAGLALNTTGQLYYLGFLSTQPADGRFHRIRVTTSQASVRLHARSGYVAARQAPPPAAVTKAASSENWESVLADARRARDAGDMDRYAGRLELLAKQFPQKMSYWYNLGVAYLVLNDAGRAVEALQEAFLLSPEHKGVTLTLSRALVAAGFYETAEEILRGLGRTHRGDVELLVQLGRVYEASGRNRDAYHVYRSILDRTASPDLGVYLMLIRTSMLIGRALEAQILMEDYLARGGSPDRIKQWSDVLTPRLP